MAITTISKKSKAANAQKVNPLIFVIEDDKLQLEILKDHLESTTQGADIKVFATAEECFAKMGSRKPAMLPNGKPCARQACCCLCCLRALA